MLLHKYDNAVIGYSLLQSIAQKHPKNRKSFLGDTQNLLLTASIRLSTPFSATKLHIPQAGSTAHHIFEKYPP